MCIEESHKELGHVTMDKIWRVGQQAGDPGELILQLQSEGHLLEN